jgi:hypothetical protein
VITIIRTSSEHDQHHQNNIRTCSASSD